MSSNYPTEQDEHEEGEQGVQGGGVWVDWIEDGKWEQEKHGENQPNKIKNGKVPEQKIGKQRSLTEQIFSNAAFSLRQIPERGTFEFFR
ncbi:uncharacterized protein SPSK_01325 [Sporothrix schenckii 1099-18]|uniref:Uncharacterized protein n=1 Tax=Sporothrix schenckii 1099-18 TaxID=1397361 RepID=A0A0F2LZF7_SPOSC|nr:uncharacterized protein SPSK_01325 [Sporothrix schenckii 1099-18]KJR81281.1 hypothetical protein SPSK_01325 [Sporothrix schenckii 1099-18]